MLSLKGENLVEVNYAEKFTLQVSPKQALCEKKGVFWPFSLKWEAFRPSEKRFLLKRVYSRPNENSIGIWVLYAKVKEFLLKWLDSYSNYFFFFYFLLLFIFFLLYVLIILWCEIIFCLSIMFSIRVEWEILW